MYVIGLDIGGTKSAAVLAQADGEHIAFMGRKELPTTGDWREILGALCDFVQDMAQEKGVVISECTVGISCGGPLSPDRRLICSPPNLVGWDDVPIVEYIKERLGLQAYMENDADACALAEWKYGAGKGCQNMVFLTFGTGLGSGLILDGRLYRGARGLAGEAGHIRLEPDGPLGYGKRGSFEGFCSGGGISRLADEYVKKEAEKGRMVTFSRGVGTKDSGHGACYRAGHPEGRLAAQGSFTAKELAQAASAGDPDARELFRISGREFGRGLSILIDLLNPERIVAGSIYARCHELLDETMYEEIEREALSNSRLGCEILPAMLGEQIGDYGAVMAALYGAAPQSFTFPSACTIII